MWLCCFSRFPGLWGRRDLWSSAFPLSELGDPWQVGPHRFPHRQREAGGCMQATKMFSILLILNFLKLRVNGSKSQQKLQCFCPDQCVKLVGFFWDCCFSAMFKCRRWTLSFFFYSVIWILSPVLWIAEIIYKRIDLQRTRTESAWYKSRQAWWNILVFSLF